MVTPENLDQILAALKYAGVTRARFGDVEFDFAPEVTPPDYAPQQPVPMPVVSQPAPVINGQIVTRPQYAALFGDEAPRFRPAE